MRESRRSGEGVATQVLLDIGRSPRFDSFACPDRLQLARYMSFLPARDTLEDTFYTTFFVFILYNSTSTAVSKLSRRCLEKQRAPSALRHPLRSAYPFRMRSMG